MKKFYGTDNNKKQNLFFNGFVIFFFFLIALPCLPTPVYSLENTRELSDRKITRSINKKLSPAPLVISRESEDLFWSYSQTLLKSVPESDGMLILKTAKLFLNTPYKASTLEHDQEILFASFTQLDCTTFVDTVLALSGSIRDAQRYGKVDLNNFAGRLQYNRYRNGKVQYTNRLHYITD